MAQPWWRISFLRIVERQGLAVVEKFLVGDVTLAMSAQLVRARHHQCRRAVKLDLLPGRQYDFERALGFQAELLAARQVVSFMRFNNFSACGSMPAG